MRGISWITLTSVEGFAKLPEESRLSVLPRNEGGAGGTRECGAAEEPLATEERDCGTGERDRDGAGVELEEYEAESSARMLRPEPISVVTIFLRVLRAHIL